MEKKLTRRSGQFFARRRVPEDCYQSSGVQHGFDAFTPELHFAFYLLPYHHARAEPYATIAASPSWYSINA